MVRTGLEKCLKITAVLEKCLIFHFALKNVKKCLKMVIMSLKTEDQHCKQNENMSLKTEDQHCKQNENVYSKVA